MTRKNEIVVHPFEDVQKTAEHINSLAYVNGVDRISTD